jgi:hypothetical protein
MLQRPLAGILSCRRVGGEKDGAEVLGGFHAPRAVQWDYRAEWQRKWSCGSEQRPVAAPLIQRSGRCKDSRDLLLCLPPDPSFIPLNFDL